MTKKLFGGRYELRSSLARGARSDVFLAHDQHLDRDVVVKILDESATAGEADKFKKDILALASLDSEFLAPVYDLGQERPVFAAMRYIAGETLAAALAEERAFEPVRAARYTLDILKALQTVRRHSLACNLTPAHVLLAPSRAYVLGVGTRTIPDESADVARAGVTFLQLVLGRQDAHPEQLDTLTFPAAFALIISAALAPAERRYTSVGAMAAALALALRQME